MLPTNSKLRKDLPITTGVLDYFPLAISYVALVSKVGNDKHNPGEPLHWARGKSDDHPDCIGRHLVERSGFDDANVLHAGALAWRALANLQLTIEGYQRRGVDVFDRNGLSQRNLVEGGDGEVLQGVVGDAGAGEAAVDTGPTVGPVLTINEEAHGHGHSDGRDGEAGSSDGGSAAADVDAQQARAA